MHCHCDNNSRLLWWTFNCPLKQEVRAGAQEESFPFYGKENKFDEIEKQF